MKEFKNEYIFDKKISIEANKEFVKYYAKTIWVRIASLIVISAGLIFFIIQKNPAFIFFVIFGILGLLTPEISIATAVKNQMTNIRKMYHQDYFEPTYIIGEYITFAINGKKQKQKFSLEDILIYRETENLILIILKNKMFVPLKKDAFIQGDLEGFRNFLKELKK